MTYLDGRRCICVLIALAALAAYAAGPARGATASEIVSAQEEHSERLLSMDGVVGTAAGSEAVLVLCETRDAAGSVPDELDGVPVETKITGAFDALSSSGAGERRGRPVPIGVSTSAQGRERTGTIACRVTDGAQVYALSTWHTWAQGRSVGSAVVQPPGSSASSDSVLGTISGYRSVAFASGTVNRADAAVALTSTEKLGVATPDEGYGLPSSGIVQPSPGLSVQKYGAGTGLTTGSVIGTNGILDVRYGTETARFVDQIIVGGGGTFSGSGDSGALVVTRYAAEPVGLLFAGAESGNVAAANSIGVVLATFGVSVDNRELTDLAVTDLSAERVDGKVDVTAAVRNVGARAVQDDIQVELKLQNNGVVATGTVSGGLAVRESQTLTFTWQPPDGTDEPITLVAAHRMSDEKSRNDSATTTLPADATP